MKNKVLSLLLLLSIFFLLGTSMLYAQAGGGASTGGPGGSSSTGGPGGSAPTSGGVVTLDNPFAAGNNLMDLAVAIVDKIILPIGGVLAVLAFIYSGFQYVMAQGDPGKIKTAHNALLYSAIGTALLLGAWTFANVIQNTVKQLMN